MLEQAYAWLTDSGIQEPGGGVARYYRSDLQQNAPVSNEITGYAVSALVHLHSRLPAGASPAQSLEPGLKAARFLAAEAWSPQYNTIPFEPGSPYAYFFDIGIIVRGLLAAYRASAEEALRACATRAALSLAFDFLGEAVFHPIIQLPEKEPLPYEPARWSRAPGCYQLKSALAWHDIGQQFGDQHAARAFEVALASALATHERFLAAVPDPEKTMDRLHAYCYFLEALVVANRTDCADVLQQGIAQVGKLLRDISPAFERSDVCAQLLRVRLIAHHLGAVPLDQTAAADEAKRAASYQAVSDDRRIHGGFWFGRKGTQMLPYVNPVSTAFCAQALVLWDDHCKGEWRFQPGDLI
jgi:hypothetical protein